MKKSLILVSALIVLAVLVGCNADQIAGFGKSMEKIGDMGLGTRNNESMTAAVENVKAYISDTEKYMILCPPSGEKYDAYFDFVDGGKEAYVKATDETINILLNAKDSSAVKKDLKNALNAKYEGKNTSKAYRNLYTGLSRESALLGGLLEHLENEDGRQNLIMILTSFLHVKVTGDTLEAVNAVLEKLKVTELPFPLQSSDYTMMVGKLFPQLKSVIDLVKSSSSSSSGKKFNMDALVQFQRDILNSVGQRDYQTVGDKIVVGIVYDVLNTVILIDNGFRADPSYFDPNNPSYDKFFEYVFEKGKGLSYLDHIFNCLDAIAYVYDVKLDISGIVSGNI